MQAAPRPTALTPTGGAPDALAMTGQTNAEARALLARVGPNELTARHRFALARQVLRYFANPLVLILLLASIVTASLG